MDPAASSGSRDLIERGYAVFPGVLESGAVAMLRSAIESTIDALAPAALHAREAQPIAPGVAITPTGVAHARLLAARPDLRSLVLDDRVLATIGAVLGPMRLEIAGAIVSDRTRPFFRWHTHIDGVEEGVRLRARRWPVVPDARRVLTLLYLDDVDADGGPLLVLPRRVGDPTEPPHDIDAPDWSGQVELRPRRGTLVAIEQCTWHAARAQTREGRRIVVGCYLAARGEPPAPWADPDLAATLG